MESHPLTDLLQDLSQLIAHAGLKLELLADNYLASRVRLRSIRPSAINRLQQGQSYPIYNQESEVIFSVIQAISQKAVNQDDQHLNSNAFNFYLIGNKSRIQELFPHCTNEQIIAIAARQFRELPSAYKIKYLRHPVSQIQPINASNLQSCNSSLKLPSSERYSHHPFRKQKASSSQTLQRSQDVLGMAYLFDHSTIDYAKAYSSSKGTYSEQTVQTGKVLDQYKRQNEEVQNKHSRSNDPLENSRKGEEREGKTNNDIYRMVLAGKAGQRQERNGNRGDQGKEKTQFQTLKSLFKKLQSNT